MSGRAHTPVHAFLSRLQPPPRCLGMPACRHSLPPREAQLQHEGRVATGSLRVAQRDLEPDSVSRSVHHRARCLLLALLWRAPRWLMQVAVPSIPDTLSAADRNRMSLTDR